LYDALPIEAKGGHRTNEGVVSVKRTVSPFVPLSLRTAPVSRSFGLRSSLVAWWKTSDSLPGTPYKITMTC
jgi:hypothetical protein